MAKTLYNNDYQNSFLAHALCDTDFLKAVAGQIEPEHFSADVSQRLLRVILSFHEQEKSAPGSLILEVIENFKTRGLVPEKLANQLSVYAKELLELPRQHRHYLLERFDSFIKSRKLTSLIQKLTNYAQKDDLDAAESLIHGYVKDRKHTAVNATRDGGLYAADPTERVQRRQESEFEKLYLLIKELDAYDVGLRRGHFGLVVSQFSGAGKSLALAHVVTRSVFQGYRVLYFLVGELSRDEAEDRLDAMVAGLPLGQLDEDGVKLIKRLRNMFRFKGQVWTEALPADRHTVRSLRELAIEIENTDGFSADVVVVDYADNLIPEFAERSDLAAADNEIAKSLKVWAQEEHKFVWTAAQGTKDAQDVVKVGQRQVGGGRGKSQQADLLITINRTADEQAKNLTRLYIAKARHNRSGMEVLIKSDFARMQFCCGPRGEDQEIGPHQKGKQ